MKNKWRKYCRRHRVYMTFMLCQGWHCQFLEEDLKTPLPRKVVLIDKQDLVAMAERGGCSFNLEARQAIDRAIQMAAAAHGWS